MSIPSTTSGLPVMHAMSVEAEDDKDMLRGWALSRNLLESEDEFGWRQTHPPVNLLPVAGTQWEDAKQVATQVSVQVAPVGLKALGYGLLGAALTMAAVESVQMMQLLPKTKLMGRKVNKRRSNSVVSIPSTTSGLPVMHAMSVEVEDDKDMLRVHHEISSASTETCGHDITFEDKLTQTLDPCTVTTASVSTEPLEALVSKSIQCSPVSTPTSPISIKVTELGSSKAPSQLTAFDAEPEMIALSAITTAATRDELVSVESCGSTTAVGTNQAASGKFCHSSRLCPSSMFGPEDEDGVTDIEETSSGCLITSSAIGLSELPDWLPTPNDTAVTPGIAEEVLDEDYNKQMQTERKSMSATEPLQFFKAMTPSPKSTPPEFFKPLNSSSGEDDVFVSFDNLPSWGQASKCSLRNSPAKIHSVISGSKKVSFSSPGGLWIKESKDLGPKNAGSSYEDAWQRYQHAPRVKFDMLSPKTQWKEAVDFDESYSGQRSSAKSEPLPPVGPQAFATIVSSPSEVPRASKLCVALRNVCPDCGVVILMLPQLDPDFDSDMDILKYMLVRTMPNMKINAVDPLRFGVRRISSSTNYSPITYTSHHMVAH
ncbi:unnamed protein product [Notodromas monacha]|uniref:Uncharacterized protein n=1 Tax=Notodromas monacha TaxID=399045 RepID=A0A7R9GFV4_9CRUS|nr:unnamed protein product [Notodromas monacha]CAG0921166.1 unnamed protein product [Notodromas monacha]